METSRFPAGPNHGDVNGDITRRLWLRFCPSPLPSKNEISEVFARRHTYYYRHIRVDVAKPRVVSFYLRDAFSHRFELEALINVQYIVVAGLLLIIH